MIRWYHAIFSAYGFWLPNDPRGSRSDFVHAWELYRFGGSATKVAAKRSHARDPHDASFRRVMKEHLKYRPARFDEACRESIARAFARACEEFDFHLHACAIGFDHVHIVPGRDPQRDVERVVAVLKARATAQMNLDGTNPMRAYNPAPTPWGKGCWSVFIDDEAQLRNAIRYVELHPEKEGMARQEWNFVRPPFPG